MPVDLLRPFAVAALLTCLGAPAAMAEDLSIRLAGTIETVFDYTEEACEPLDVPDGPARAFRDADGTIRLIATHYVNRAFVGPDLDALRHDCTVIYRGGNQDDPAAYDDRAWLMSPYTLDGSRVFALVHNEYHGHHRRGLCASGSYRGCWENAVTWAVSTDGGRSFNGPGPERRAIAMPPWRYEGDRGRPVGLFNPSNIVAKDGFYYTLVFTRPWGAQKGGVCLLRTDRLEDPEAWRAWDGEGFIVRFADPYREPAADPDGHVCAPVGAGLLTGSVTSLVRHEPSGLFIALQAALRPPEPGAEPVSGVYAAVSRDLVQWSWPTLVWEVPTWGHFSCPAQQWSIGYPSLLDPSSPSRNFETVADEAYLYFTRYNLDGCAIGRDRDLARVRVRLTGGGAE